MSDDNAQTIAVLADKVKTCRYCRHALWRTRRNNLPDFTKPGLCNLVADKRIIVSAASSCGKWERG
jgi:hypothetical protein